MNTTADPTPYAFAPEERPTFPGSPYAPKHTVLARIGYGAAGLAIGCASTFTNALVNVNVGNIAGSLGLYVAEASVLPAIYVAMNATANLTLVKARAQFGIPQITLGLLSLYLLAAATAALFPGMTTAVMVRAACGVTAAGLVTLSIYYFMQVLPPKARPLALVLGISLPQLGTPFARLVPLEALALNHWTGLYLIEMAVALALIAILLLHPLPPSDRSRAFTAPDLVTICLVVPGTLLLCVVLGEGRVLWWSDTPWLGWALVLAIGLLAAALVLERRRAEPLIHLEWISSATILRFAGVAVLVRLALAEQTYGSVGLLSLGGLTSDQLHALFLWIILGMILGCVAAALTLSERRIPGQVLVASLIIALGAWLDTDATNLTRPPQLYFSQTLIAFGTTLFMGPALLYGFLQMIAKGPSHLVSFIVLFSTTQNLGGLAGSALLGTYQIERTRMHAAAISEHLVSSNPDVFARLQAGASIVTAIGPDMAARAGQGSALLGQAMNREASVLAYCDVFWLVTVLAVGTAIYVAYLIGLASFRRRRLTLAETA